MEEECAQYEPKSANHAIYNLTTIYYRMTMTNSNKLFHWTEEKTALLLKVVFDYRTAKSAVAQDWEKICFKHDVLSKRFIEAYPVEKTEEFP